MTKSTAVRFGWIRRVRHDLVLNEFRSVGIRKWCEWRRLGAWVRLCWRRCEVHTRGRGRFSCDTCGKWEWLDGFRCECGRLCLRVDDKDVDEIEEWLNEARVRGRGLKCLWEIEEEDCFSRKIEKREWALSLEQHEEGIRHSGVQSGERVSMGERKQTRWVYST